MTDDDYLSGRLAADWELPALERARQHERDQALALLAGVLTVDNPVPQPIGVERRMITLPDLK
jgi:hypothetical protein